MGEGRVGKGGESVSDVIITVTPPPPPVLPKHAMFVLVCCHYDLNQGCQFWLYRGLFGWGGGSY